MDIKSTRSHTSVHSSLVVSLVFLNKPWPTQSGALLFVNVKDRLNQPDRFQGSDGKKTSNSGLDVIQIFFL
jgi:hypothetical protein